jgi:hypothetical protein
MNKAQTILHNFLTADLPLQVINLPVGHYGVLSTVEVHLTQKDGETYFEFSLCEGPTGADLRNVPPRTITNAFLGLDSPAAGKRFFDLYGDWGVDVKSKCRLETMKWSEILAFQKMLRKAWIADFSRWDRDIIRSVFDLELRPDFTKRPPSLFFVTSNVKEILMADLCFATLSGLPTGFCARKDCGKLFQKSTKHERKFCSVDCAHVESVRLHRKRKSKKEGE